MQPEPEVAPEQPAGPAKEENLILSSEDFADLIGKLENGDILINDNNEQIKYENGKFYKI